MSGPRVIYEGADDGLSSAADAGARFAVPGGSLKPRELRVVRDAPDRPEDEETEGRPARGAPPPPRRAASGVAEETETSDASAEAQTSDATDVGAVASDVADAVDGPTKLERLQSAVRALEHRVAFGAPAARLPDRVSTGFAELDRSLGGGLVRGALNEVYSGAAGDGAAEALLPALGRAGGRRLWCWIHPTRTPYPPALAQAGFDLTRWLVVRPADEDDHVWAIDLALRSGACEAVVAYVGDLSDRLLRRLQTAAEEGRCLALLFRPAALAPRASPAAARLLAEPAVAPDPRRRRLVFRVLRARGVAFPFPVEVEWSRDPLDEPPVSRVFERADPARGARVGARRAGAHGA